MERIKAAERDLLGGPEQMHNCELKDYFLQSEVLKSYKPFLAAMGFMGLCLPDGRVGDVVIVFYGARVPFVLRRTGSGEYRLVGEAYCDTVMDGEALGMGLKEQLFRLV
jgi:hypothetical protein